MMIEVTRDWVAAQALAKPQGHKYDHGHALILSGGVGQGGAARMAARAALRIGAGAVTLGCPPAALIENAMAVDAVMTRKIADADALDAVLGDARINALCLGPGFGMGAREAALVNAACAARERAVLDADALTLIGRDADLFKAVPSGAVLTPHAGEFARVFPGIDLKADRVAGVCTAAAQIGATVLLKGPETLIAGPDGTVWRHDATGDAAVPWLATAGAGDVLAGLITGLLARGLAPGVAAACAAWLHADAARAFGPGLIAEDLPDLVPQVLRRVLE